jgi:hypothetical protein
MKKALVLTLLLLGVGAAAFAGPISGSAEVCARFDKTDLTVFDTVVDLDYTISSFTFGITAVFDLDAFDNLFFTAAGTLGTFELRSMLDFEPQTPAFMAWTNAGKISLGGATLFGVFMMQELGDPGDGTLGVGATVGIYGTAGDVNITGAAYFNMTDVTYYYHFYGYDWAVARDAYQSCGTWYKPSWLPYSTLAAGCGLAWSGASIYADFPFVCLDVTAYLSFSCTGGFDGFGLWFTGIETGIPWLSLAEIDIDFDVQTKTVTVFWDLVFGDFVCVTPYITLDGAGASITGLTLNALLLEYSYNGVTVKAGEIFDNTWYSWALNGSVYTWGFTLDGGLSYSCYYVLAYDEFFGVWIDGDSCCGGAYDIAVINFFDTSATGSLFDWQETVATLEVGIGTNVSVEFSMSLKSDGLQWFQLCGKFNF